MSVPGPLVRFTSEHFQYARERPTAFQAHAQVRHVSPRGPVPGSEA